MYDNIFAFMWWHWYYELLNLWITVELQYCLSLCWGGTHLFSNHKKKLNAHKSSSCIIEPIVLLSLDYNVCASLCKAIDLLFFLFFIYFYFIMSFRDVFVSSCTKWEFETEKFLRALFILLLSTKFFSNFFISTWYQIEVTVFFSIFIFFF